MEKKSICPVCGNSNLVQLYDTQVPVLQNRVYDTLIEARESSIGKISLANCQDCNFTFNCEFDQNIIVYDQNYDNSVPSSIFESYYESICQYLFQTYNLENGIVYDIGCGKGTFLKLLCKLFPSIKGVGIDPSYVGDLQPLPNLLFIQDFFNEEYVNTKPDLILSRHVFEHIEFPSEFLFQIWSAIKKFENVPIFLEVPDFSWIVSNQTFWDICYEHCNYFSEKSLQKLLNTKYSNLCKISKGFGNQYLWVEGIFKGSTVNHDCIIEDEISQTDLKRFVSSIQDLKNNVLLSINEYKRKDFRIILWGMATKGVIFSNIIDPECTIIDFCIDINHEKQNKHSPISGHLIQGPESLSSIEKQPCLIVVMNTNYLVEIINSVSALELNPIFIDAHGNGL